MVYVTGDLHGDENRLFDREWRKLKPNDTVIVLGDFGFLWDNSDREKEAIKYLSSRKYNVCFLDGTHENFDLINKGRTTYYKGGKVDRIKDKLYHLKRGEIFNIEGIKFFVFGGGESADKDEKSDMNNWWRNELPTPTEMALAAAKLDEEECKIDYILTHEPPSLVKSAMLLRKGREDSTNKLNGFFQEIDNTCRFEHWYFASLHEDRRVTPKHTCVFKKLIPLTPVKHKEIIETTDLTQDTQDPVEFVLKEENEP